MEEEVGIFDPEGLLAYAAYFRDALVGGGRIESRNAGSSTIDDYGAVDFVLQYKIGTHILEGRLQVHGDGIGAPSRTLNSLTFHGDVQLMLVQPKVDVSMLSMMRGLYQFDASRKVSRWACSSALSSSYDALS
jgi:hypothetical protein